MDGNADGGNFSIFHPYTDVIVLGVAVNIVVPAQELYEEGLDVVDKALYFTLMVPQIDNRVADQLPGPVVGGLTAPVDPGGLYPAAAQDLFREEHVRICPPFAQGNYVGVLQQQKGIGDFLAAAFFDK